MDDDKVRDNTRDNSGRRRFLTLGSIAVVVLAGGGQALAQTSSKSGDKGAKDSGKAADKGAPRLTENDPQAQALGYKEDATKVDRKKFASYQPGQLCDNCQQYQGTAKDPRAPCTIFAGKSVNAKGWCSAWVKKSG
jgi:hypothetical protein